MLQNLSFTPLWPPVLTAVTRYFMAVKSPLSNAYNVSRTMPPELSVKSLSTTTSLQFWRNSTGCRSRLGLNINFSPLLSNVSMIKPQHICLNLFFAMFPPVLVSALWTISLYLYRKLFPGQTRAQQIVLFLCLPLNCGTRFLLKYETLGPLLILNVNWKHFYLQNIFNSFNKILLFYITY